jgi:hypothetical protein
MDIVNAALLIVFTSLLSVGGVLVTLWFVGRRKRLQAEKAFAVVVPASVGPEPSPPIATPPPPQPAEPIATPPVPALDPTAVQEALAKLANGLNETMTTVQTHANWFGIVRQQFDAHTAGISGLEGDIRRIDAQLHALRNPMKPGKMYSSIGDFLTKPGQEAPKLPKPGQSATEPVLTPPAQQDDDDEPGPHDIDEPDAEFDDDGNMIAIKPTLAEPDPAPMPPIPDKSLPTPKNLKKRSGKK